MKKEMTIKSTRMTDYTGNLFSWHFPRGEYGENPYEPSFGWMEKMYKERG
jgi:hypothetical protein